MENKKCVSQLVSELSIDKKDSFLWVIICQLQIRHPLPWKAEQDWDGRIYDAKGVYFMSFPSKEEADYFIGFVVCFGEEQKESWEKTKKELNLEDVE